MAWKPWRGPFKMYWGQKAASQVLTTGAVVDQTSGYVTVASIAVMSHLGVVQKTITAADDDYASTTRIPVKVPASPGSEWKVSVLSSDTLAQANVGTYLDLAGSPVGIDVTDATSDDDAAYCTEYISDNVGLFALNSQKFMQSGIGTT